MTTWTWPRADTLYVSQSRTVLGTGRDGFITGGPDHGLFVHQTRLLSRYCYRLDDEPPQAVALPTVEPYTWPGYYVAPRPPPRRVGAAGRRRGQL